MLYMQLSFLFDIARAQGDVSDGGLEADVE